MSLIEAISKGIASFARDLLFENRDEIIARSFILRKRCSCERDIPMTLSQRKIIDADGHVAEDAQAIIAHMPEAYREKARVQPFNPFPPFDHLHAGISSTCRRARSIARSGRRSGWLF